MSRSAPKRFCFSPTTRSIIESWFPREGFWESGKLRRRVVSRIGRPAAYGRRKGSYALSVSTMQGLIQFVFNGTTHPLSAYTPGTRYHAPMAHNRRQRRDPTDPPVRILKGLRRSGAGRKNFGPA